MNMREFGRIAGISAAGMAMGEKAMAIDHVRDIHSKPKLGSGSCYN